MIEELEIHGVGGIRDASLKFSGDFIVITGESGAGKSSLVRALEFISGRRAQINQIHSQEQSCEVQAVMSSEQIPGIADRCQPQDGTLIARRTFSRSGKGRCMLQEQTTPLTILGHAMESNVVIQSQFAQLSLIDPLRQLELVDSCGGGELKRALAELEAAFTAALATEKEILTLKKRRAEGEKRFENAPAIIRQAAQIGLTESCESEWENELREIERRENSAKAVRGVAEKMNGAEGGLLDQLEKVARSLHGLASSDTRWLEAIEKTLTGAQELSNLLNEACRGADEGSCEEAKERLERKTGVLRKMKRLLNLPTSAALLEYTREAGTELEWMKQSISELDALEKRSQELRRETSRLAIEVRGLRKESALQLSERVNGHLGELGMEHSLFNIEIEPLDRVRSTGAENAVFTLALPDQQPLPVGKNASGGELSRILIALQLSVGDDKLPGTLVFDEVEAGLGGRTALLAGGKLRQLSRRCRTILITHQASIAAMADQHFVVIRTGDDTEITAVEGEAREREIARMLSGDEDSPEALEHAKALLAPAEQ